LPSKKKLLRKLRPGQPVKLRRVSYRWRRVLRWALVPPVVATKGYFGEYPAGGALPLVGPLVDEEAHSGLGLARPEIAFEFTQGHQAESVEPDVAVVTLPDVPGKHAGAGIVGRRLSKFAGAWNTAAADVEPIADKTPLGDRIHDAPPELASVARP